MTDITIRKVEKADRGFGERSCSLYTPAVYGIFADERRVGTIRGQQVRYMEPQQWTVYRLDGDRPICVAYTPTLRAAKLRALGLGVTR